MSAERVAEVLRPFTDIAAGLEQGAPDSPLARDVAADLRAGVERAAALLAEPTDQDQRETRTEWRVRWTQDGHVVECGDHDPRSGSYREDAVIEWREVEVGPWVEDPSP